MKPSNKENTAMIMAGEGFRYDGCKSEGYKVFKPYKGKGIINRIIREVFFRCPFLPDEVWYRKDIIDENIDYIIVFDAIITSKYLEWLCSHFPSAQINFKYENLIGKARHIMPDAVPAGIRIWTYDRGDSERYGIRLYDSYIYFKAFIKQKLPPQYDVFFVGRDKGRGDRLVEFEKKLNEAGIKTKFVITADGRFSRRKKYYQPELSYDEVLDYLSKSKAVLNITMPGQTGITVRDSESVFQEIKLITTNKDIIRADFYNSSNVFILDQWDPAGMREFLDLEYIRPEEDLKDKHTMETAVKIITSNS